MTIIKHVTLQKIVAHDFRYDPRILRYFPHTATSELLRPTALHRTYSQTPNDEDVSCNRVMQ